MKTWLPLLTFVLLVPAAGFAAEPTGTSVVVPDTANDGGSTGPATRSSLAGDLFFVRSHTCRSTAGVPCGPDPLIDSGASFNAIARLFVPAAGSYTVYTFVTDVEGAVVAFGFGTFSFGTGTYNNVSTPFPALPAGLYRLVSLAAGNSNTLIAFGPNPYGFRISPTGGGGCCP